MRIVNPAFGRHIAEDAPVLAVSRGPIDLARDTLTLFSNTKPNAKELLEGVAQRLRGAVNAAQIAFVQKDGASTPAALPLIEQVAARSRLALLALGD